MPIVQRSKQAAEEVRDAINDPVDAPKILPYEGNFEKMVSTGSTALDLAISGGRVRGGGIPAGIMIEIYGPSGKGKTAVLAEIAGSIQAKGGDVLFLDPEARLDQEYARIYGIALDKTNYARPDTVTEVFDLIRKWKPKNKDGAVCGILTDSLAALSTNLELDKGDTMGMRRAKEFSEGFRKVCRVIKNNNWVIPCSNQVRQGKYGEVTPGGNAIEFYSSLRIRVSSPKEDRYILNKAKLTLGEQSVEVSETSGIHSLCRVIKSSVDNPFREADIYITFNYGIDDVRANLQYVKDMMKSTRYDCINKQYQSLDRSVSYIENEGLELQLKEKVIDIWKQVQQALKIERKPKVR